MEYRLELGSCQRPVSSRNFQWVEDDQALSHLLEKFIVEGQHFIILINVFLQMGLINVRSLYTKITDLHSINIYKRSSLLKVAFL